MEDSLQHPLGHFRVPGDAIWANQCPTQRFIRNYSQEAAPLTALTSPSRPFVWSEEAEKAFNRLRTLFTCTAPVLVQPDPAQQFVVEVDASDIGSEQSCPREHGGLTSGVAGGQDGAGGVAPLVRGVIQPFVVWTDHKNLAYIQAAKRLNSRQARWALFFSRFDFVLTYRPGSRNIKPDALSRQFSVEEKVQEEENILPTSRVIAAITWDIENAVLRAQQQQPDPGQGPPGRLFVPDADFVTGLPPSNGKTVILTIVDRFSKAAHFVALAKLPTARETADLLANHVVRLHGIPRDIVSDRGPQFISQVWKSFCKGLGASVKSHLRVSILNQAGRRRGTQDLESAAIALCHGRQPEYLVHIPPLGRTRSQFPGGKGPRPPWRPLPFSGIGDRQTSTDYLLPSTPKVVTSALSPPPDPPPPARIIDDHPAFTVRRLLDVRRRGRGLSIWWTGRVMVRRNDHEIPRRQILDHNMVKRFHRDHPDKPKGSPGGDR
ncbi:hypothetical protein L3Q82_025563 [Scortum barcoo]|uniref:Uncharacterized protein n=1 Tax=Scortum barcoo TaxID=214431 RepID=A0ACB8WKE9_9TELE|nr:hypothetical protein L3Q82_025563 [Scortum barcoo]